MYPTQTSGFITLNMTFPATTFAGTSTVFFTTLAGPIPSWLTTVPSTVQFTYAAGATSATTTFRFQASGGASVGTLSVFMSTGGAPAGIGTGSISVQILQPSYTSTAAPNPVSIAWGGSRNVTVTTTPDPGYNTSIQYSFSGFPSGITWGTPQQAMPPTYFPTSFTFSVDAGTAPGTYNGTLAASSATNKTFPMSVIVLPPDITASFTQPSISLCNGGPPNSNGIVLQPANGYAGTPKLSFTVVPAGLTEAPVALTANKMPPGQTVPFTVSASGASPGVQLMSLRIVDVTAGVDKTIQLAVNVSDGDFTPAVSPLLLNLVPGGASQSLTASPTPNACFNASSVTVTPSGAPAGVIFAPSTAISAPPSFPPATFAVQAGAGTTPGTYPVTFSFQPSAGSVKTVPVTLVVAAAPDFTLAVSPPSLSLAPGSSSTVSVSATGINGFSGPIAVSAPALAGVTFTPGAFTLTPGGTQTVAVQVAASASPGGLTATFTGTVTGFSGPRTASFLLTILAPPDFSLSVSPSLLTVAAGASGAVTVSATGLNGFSGSIAVTAPALAGVTFAPGSFTLTPGGSQTVTVQVAASALPGDVMATFTGTAAAVPSPRTAAFTLQVTPPPDFTLAVNPGALSLTEATSGSVTVSVTGLNGFSGTVTVASPILAGVTFSPASFAVAAGGTQTVTIAVAGTAPPGTYAAQFSGTASGVSGTHIALLMFTVVPAPPVIHAVAPPTLAVGAANAVLRLAGEYFRPGATASSHSPSLQVLRTTVISPTLAEVLATLQSGARPGPYQLDLANTDGTRTSQGVIVLVYPTTSLAAPLGVTTAAIVFPRPFTLVAPGNPLFPRGLLATTGLGTIIGSWRYDGVPFDRFIVNASGGMPVEVKANVPIPLSYTGEHRLELAVEQPQELVTDPVSVIQSLESRSQLEILAPPDNTVFGDVAPLFRWSLVPAASGYEIEIERQDIPSPMRVRLSESEWRPGPQDVEAIGAGVHRFRVKAIFPGETSGEPTAWRRFAIPPKHAELRMLAPESDARTKRTVIRWEGGSPGLAYRVEFLQPDTGEPFAAALTFRQRYLVPAGMAPGGVLQVRVIALAPDGSRRGTTPPTELQIQSSLAAPGPQVVLASLGAQVTGITPPDGATVAETQPRIEVQWSGAVKPEEVVLTVDTTDVTGAAALSEGSIAYACLEPLSAGAHTVQISLAGAVTRSAFTVTPGLQADAASVSPTADAARRDWQVAAMGSGTETSDQGTVHGDAGRLQLSGQTDIGSGASQVKATADLGGRREFEPPYRTVAESKNWQMQLGATQEGYKEEGRFGYSPPDFLDQSEFLAAGLARGGAQAKVTTPVGSISYYQTFAAESAGANGSPSLAQDIKGIGIQAPWDPTRFLLRAVVLRNEGEVGSENAGVRGNAVGVFGRFVVGSGLTLLFEGAHSKVEPQGAQSPPEQSGNGFHLGATGVLGTFTLAANLRKTEATFSNPLSQGLTPGALPDRVGGDFSLSKQLGRAMVSLQLHRLSSGGGSGAPSPKATEDGAMLNLVMPLRSNVNLSVVGTWTGTTGEADDAHSLPAVSRAQQGATMTLTEVPGRLMFSQALSWQEMRDDNMPAADQTVKSATLSANGSLTQALTVAALLSGTRSEGAPPVGRTDQLMLSLQPTLTLTGLFMTVTPRGAYIEVKNDTSAVKTTTEQFQMLLQLTPPWAGSLFAFQVAADWNRSRASTQTPAPGFQRRIVGSFNLRWGAQRKPDAAPAPPMPPVVGAGLPGQPRPTSPGVWL
jgi:hypothetical protein